MEEVRSISQQFLDRLSVIVRNNIHNENFGAEELAMEARLSRSGLHRRLTKLNYQNISQFIREVRLKEAMELLQHHEGAAAEIAYRVGFGSPAYFNKCFHDYYGFPPGEVKKRTEQTATNPFPPHAVSFTNHISSHGQEGEKNDFTLNKYRILLTVSLILLAVITVWMGYTFISEKKTVTAKSKIKLSAITIEAIPFTTLTDNIGSRYFAGGLMEDIILCLGREELIEVSTKDNESDHQGIARRKGRLRAKSGNPDFLLGGFVESDNGMMKVTVTLTDNRSDSTEWSGVYGLSVNDLISESQNRLAGQIASAIAGHLASKGLMGLEESGDTIINY